jgi:hypothetical protein
LIALWAYFIAGWLAGNESCGCNATHPRKNNIWLYRQLIANGCTL